MARQKMTSKRKMTPAQKYERLDRQYSDFTAGSISIHSAWVGFIADQTAIINVSSRLGIMPAVWVPIYTSTKAGMHFFTRSLRLQLANTGVKVYEILPPMVDTDLAGAGAQANGVPVDEFVNGVMEKLADDVKEIGYGSSEYALSDQYTASVAMAEAEKMWGIFSAKNPIFENLR